MATMTELDEYEKEIEGQERLIRVRLSKALRHLEEKKYAASFKSYKEVKGCYEKLVRVISDGPPTPVDEAATTDADTDPGLPRTTDARTDPGLRRTGTDPGLRRTTNAGTDPGLSRVTTIPVSNTETYRVLSNPVINPPTKSTTDGNA